MLTVLTWSYNRLLKTVALLIQHCSSLATKSGRKTVRIVSHVHFNTDDGGSSTRWVD